MIHRKYVIEAYRNLLNRDPENEEVINHHSTNSISIENLYKTILDSHEFKIKNNIYTIHKNDLDQSAKDFHNNDRAAWEHRIYELPYWFDINIDPDSNEYKENILKLWSEITNRPIYNTQNDEFLDITDLDSTKRPAFYATGSSFNAGQHLMAIGHLLIRSHINSGDHVLEYGAGFGQTSAAFARIGANVDSVDINPQFCNSVNEVGKFYDVSLKAHIGEFGYNPSGKKHYYDLVFFYECFHHCLDIKKTIKELKEIIKPTGRVLLAGEPIFENICPALPYPWGFRLDWENVSIMRHRGWLELGFQQDYLFKCFHDAGFSCKVYKDPNSHPAQVYEFCPVN